MVRIRALLPGLRPSEQRIARFVLDNPDAAVSLPIARLAEQCGTSTTTVVRFCKQLGYAHLRELRRDVLRAVATRDLESNGAPVVTGDIGRDDTLDDVIAHVSVSETASITDTALHLDRTSLAQAIAAVSGAGRVDIFGVGASAFVGLDLQQKLVRVGRTALNWPDPHGAWTAAATLGPGAVAIAISHSGGTLDTVEFLELARARGATTVAITNNAASPLAQRADVVLTTVARESPFRAGALGSRIAQLMVVDCLFIGVAQRSYDDSMRAIGATYAAVHARRTDR
ncbi:MurR/RpiR family transcriptional regulator [Propionibacteriaceae bacterium G1746]|uniref:MurR/RpiR family transcriptional regulator n=1 Tax=Aestuariimicrobium sp. G57 TaxID=3418485 RepID=UPI003C298914